MKCKVKYIKCKQCGKKYPIYESGSKIYKKNVLEIMSDTKQNIFCFECVGEKVKKKDICKNLPIENIVCVKCNSCGKKYVTTNIKYFVPFIREGGKKCYECRCQKHSDTMKKTLAAMSPAERKANGAYGRSCVSPETCSDAVKKQWETIRADKDLYKRVCDARVGRSKEMWKKRSPEDRDRIIKTLVSSQNCTRSKFSESVKKAMQDNGLYNGFVSEEVFHGFIPDEINHDLKMIVEMYGDLYHCNPRKYKNPDLYIKTINRTVGEQWKRDRRRLACFYKHGYNVVIVWEKDFTNRPKEVIDRIRDEISKKRTS